MNTNFTPAFPTWVNDDSMMPGMTLRDYFAALAINVIAKNSNGIIGVNNYEYRIARDAYKMADAMMEARK